MNHEEFMEAREELNQHCTELLTNVKRKEYDPRDVDRLSQFKRAGALKSEHPAKSLTGMMVKHETSIHDMASAIDAGEYFGQSKWKEKIGDLRNYCDLLYALLIDEGEI